MRDYLIIPACIVEAVRKAIEEYNMKQKKQQKDDDENEVSE